MSTSTLTTDIPTPAPIPPSPNTPKPVSWKLKGTLTIVAVLLVAVAVFAWYRLRLPVQPDNQAEISLGTPDVWIHSQNLALLPHDLLQLPILKSVLTEDFLYFYEQDVDWLSLQGAIRRLSFEHDLNWSDNLLKNIAAAPADVYLWRDGTHALRYWALSIERDPLLTVAQQLAQMKLVADRQITEVGRINVDGDEIPLLKIALSSQRSLVLAAHGKRLVLFSDSAMVSRDAGELDTNAEAFVQTLLAKDAKARGKLINDSQAPELTTTHAQTVWMSNRFFAQGYGAFMPDIQALRFDYDHGTWTSQANTRKIHVDPRIWAQIPAYAAWCASTSIDWTQVEAALKSAKAPVDHMLESKALESLAPTGAVCWYTEAGDDVSKPLFIGLRTEKSTLKTEDLTALFNWGVSTNRDYYQPIREIQAKKRQLAAQLQAVNDEIKALKKSPDRSEMQDLGKEERAAREQERSDQLAAKKVEKEDLKKQQDDARDALIEAKKKLDPEIKAAEALTTQQQGGFITIKRTLEILPTQSTNPMLAFNNQVLYFSPSGPLVERAMKVADQRYPNVQEASKGLIDPKAITLLYVNPAKVATLMTETGHDALPQKSLPRLRAAFDYHMPSRMSALAQQAPFAVTLKNPSASAGGDTTAWQPMIWHSTP
ncbi:DUF2138 family protein [Aquirhabdus sp.]|uniref:DUF2138 family protein n=1 Tax=Aquirhabdus sp. TaxID=2824160 RepID=UPI00396C6871